MCTSDSHPLHDLCMNQTGSIQAQAKAASLPVCSAAAQTVRLKTPLHSLTIIGVVTVEESVSVFVCFEQRCDTTGKNASATSEQN